MLQFPWETNENETNTENVSEMYVKQCTEYSFDFMLNKLQMDILSQNYRANSDRSV